MGNMENRAASIPISQRKDGTVPVEDDVRRLLREAMKGSGKPREQIAAEMSRILGRDVTPSMLADFARNATKKRQVRFPASWVPAFCLATGDDALVRYALSEELRQNLILREGNSIAHWALENALEEVRKLRLQRGQSKRKGK